MSDQESKRVAEQLNGRLAMLGLIIATINYGLFGTIIPPLF